MKQYDDPSFFEAYSKMSRSIYGLEGAGEWHQLKKLFPDMNGADVLDLGCGYGWHCRYASENGARSIFGIDTSTLMIEEAERRNSAENIDYRVCGIEDYDYPAEKYDLVVSNLALHYIADLDTVFANVHKTLRHGGIFVMNIEHPTFTAGVDQQFSADGTWPVDNYYYPGERSTVFLGHPVTKQHHTLTQILMGIINSGMTIEIIEEAMPPEEWREIMPEEMRRPMMLLVRARKK